MAENTPTARMQKHLVLTIGENSYSGHVSSVTLTPSSSVVTWQGGTPEASLSDAAASTWTLAAAVIQDWENAGSLSNFLLAHEGEEAAVTYKPHHDGVFTIDTTVTIVAPTIGGPVNAFNESTVSMPATKPEVTAPPVV